jgi:hypothetical protein
MKKKISRATMNAMIELREHYKDLKSLGSCPLCKLHYTYNSPDDCNGKLETCTKCPWELFGHKGNERTTGCELWMDKWQKKHSIPTWELIAISGIRYNPIDHQKVAHTRVLMLNHWIRNCEVKK